MMHFSVPQRLPESWPSQSDGEIIRLIQSTSAQLLIVRKNVRFLRSTRARLLIIRLPRGKIRDSRSLDHQLKAVNAVSAFRDTIASEEAIWPKWTIPNGKARAPSAKSETPTTKPKSLHSISRRRIDTIPFPWTLLARIVLIRLLLFISSQNG